MVVPPQPQPPPSSPDDNMAPRAFTRPSTFPSVSSGQRQPSMSSHSPQSEEDDDGEWSDPAGYQIALDDDADNEEDDLVFTPAHAEKHSIAAKDDADDGGIAIPEFLQPLLGLSVLPYVDENGADTDQDGNNASSPGRHSLANGKAQDLSPISVANAPQEPDKQAGEHKNSSNKASRNFWGSGKRIFSTSSTSATTNNPRNSEVDGVAGENHIDEKDDGPSQQRDSDAADEGEGDKGHTPRSGRRVRKFFASQAAGSHAAPRGSPRTEQRKLKGPIAKRIQKMQEKRRNHRLPSQHSSDADEEASSPHEHSHDPPNDTSLFLERGPFVSNSLTSSNEMSSSPLASKHARELNSLRRHAKAMRLQAHNIEERVTQLHKHADSLQKEFARTTAQLHEETLLLQQTQQELEQVEARALAALKNYQHALDPSAADSSGELENGSADLPSTAASVAALSSGRLQSASTTDPSSVELLVAELANPLGEPLFQPRPRAPTADEAILAAKQQEQTKSSSSFDAALPPRRSSSWNEKMDDVDLPSAPDLHHKPQQPMPLRERSYTAPATSPSRSSQLPPKPQGLNTASPHASVGKTTLVATNTAEPETTAEVFATTTPAGLPVSNFFIKVGDLDVDVAAESAGQEPPQFLETLFPENRLDHKQFLPIDCNVPLVLDHLAKFGLDTATDEGDVFKPTWDTQRLIKNYNSVMPRTEATTDWPYAPWYDVPDKKEVLVWIRECPGVPWPMIKARGVLQTSPRNVVDFLLDSSQIKRYNKMCQGRDDVTIFQQGAGTTAEKHGFVGEAKVTRALNKPKLSPKTMETLSVFYAKPLPGGAYIIANRSVWENVVGPNKVKQPLPTSVIRSEMILGVQLLRPLDGRGSSENCSCCELTTITFVYSPSVPEMLAKRLAPGSAANLIRELQAIFPGSA